MNRIAEIIPRTMRELEVFYRDAIGKLKGTSATLSELDERSNWPGPAIAAEMERNIKEGIQAALAPQRAQIAELERMIYGMLSFQRYQICELERRINSLENSGRGQ